MVHGLMVWLFMVCIQRPLLMTKARVFDLEDSRHIVISGLRLRGVGSE